MRPRACRTAAQTCWAEGWSEDSVRATRNISSEERPLPSQGPFKAITSKLPPSALHPIQNLMALNSRTTFAKVAYYCPLR